MQTMTTPTQQPTTTRRRRLEAILETMNRLHCHRRVRGRATAWLLPRCRRLSAAYLEARHEESTKH